MKDRKWGICRNNEIISTDYRSVEEYVDSGNYSEIGNHNEIDLVEITNCQCLHVDEITTTLPPPGVYSGVEEDEFIPWGDSY